MCTKQLTLVETHDSVQSTRLHYFTPIQAPLQTWCWFAYTLRPQTTISKCLFGEVYFNEIGFNISIYVSMKLVSEEEKNVHAKSV